MTQKSLKIPHLISYKGEVINRVYPYQSLKLILKEIKSVFTWACYSAVWNHSFSKMDEWKNQKFPLQSLKWLKDNSEILLPETDSILKNLFATQNSSISLNDIATIIIQLMNEIQPAINSARNDLKKIKLPDGQKYESWQTERIDSIEKSIVDSFVNEIRSTKPEGLSTVLLHGSLADGCTKIGFSDFDVYYVISIPRDNSTLINLMEWIFESNRFLLSYNPCMHHGPMIVFEEELSVYSESNLPGILVEKGVWLTGKVEEVYSSGGDFDCIYGVTEFKSFFEQNFSKSTDIKNIFDAIWWTSSIFFLPLLVAQMISKKSHWKGNILTDKQYIPNKFWDLFDRSTLIRENISRYVIENVNLPLQMEHGKLNPGIILKQNKEVLALTAVEVGRLGITDELLEKGREYYQYCENVAYKTNDENFLINGYSYKDVNSNWIKNVCEIPSPIPLSDYDDVREKFSNRCSLDKNVVAVYEFGNVGCPGLSDLDFLVVLSDSYFGIPEELTITKMSKPHADIMNHDPLFVSESEVKRLGMLSPLFGCTLIYGKQLHIPTTDSFDTYFQEICFTLQNLVKYPNDLIWLSKQKEIRWKTILAYLNSFHHIKKTISVITEVIPESIQLCVDFNIETRKKFKNNISSLEDLNHALVLMIEASVDMISLYLQFWKSKFPEISYKSIEAIAENYKRELYSSLNSEETIFPHLPPLLDTILLILRGKQLPNQIDHKMAILIEAYLKEYLDIKEEYIKRELNMGRVISYYIADPEELETLKNNINNQNQETTIGSLRTITRALTTAEEAIGNNDLVEGRNLLATILESEPGNLFALNNLAVVEILEDNFESALSLINKVLKTDPDNQIAIGNLKILRNIYNESTRNSNKDFEPVLISRESPFIIKNLSNEIQNIIWFRTDSIGDNILATSMLKYIKETLPKSNITVVCQEHIVELYEFCPHIESVIGFNKLLMGTDADYKNQIFEKLNMTKPDILLNSVYSNEQLTHEFTLASTASIRIGYMGDLSNINEENQRLGNSYYTHLIQPTEGNILEIRRHEEFLDAIGVKHEKLNAVVWLSDEDMEWVNEFWQINHLEGKEVTALFAGAQHANKNYENYGVALKTILENSNYTLILLGEEKDRNINLLNIDTLQMNVLDLTGTTSLRQSAAIIKKCKWVVGADTSLAHVASAFKVKNVILLGGGHFGRFLPYSSSTSVVSLPMECFGCNWACKYTREHCVKDIDPEIISVAIKNAIVGKSSHPKIIIQNNSIGAEQFEKWLAAFINIEEIDVTHIGNSVRTVYEDYKEDVASYITNHQTSILKAEEEIEKGNLGFAAEILGELLMADNTNTFALNDLAVIRILEKDYKGAMKILKIIGGIDPTNEIALGNIKYLTENNLVVSE
jgi:ADP-heptose:LPS heptosyltransferase